MRWRTESAAGAAAEPAAVHRTNEQRAVAAACARLSGAAAGAVVQAQPRDRGRHSAQHGAAHVAPLVPQALSCLHAAATRGRGGDADSADDDDHDAARDNAVDAVGRVFRYQAAGAPPPRVANASPNV